jgi:hypothetical protein
LILIEEKAEGGDMLARLARAQPSFLQGYERVVRAQGWCFIEGTMANGSWLRSHRHLAIKYFQRSESETNSEVIGKPTEIDLVPLKSCDAGKSPPPLPSDLAAEGGRSDRRACRRGDRPGHAAARPERVAEDQSVARNCPVSV